MKLNRPALLITLHILTLPARATEFSAGFLQNSKLGDVDLSSFSRDGYVSPGDYLLDIYLNDKLIRDQYRVSVVDTGNGGSTFCITPELTDMFGLKEEYRRRLSAVEETGGHCLSLNTADSRTRYSPDSQSLSVTLPQAWMEYQDPDWVPTARWREGVNGLILDYNLTANRYMPHQGNTSTSYSSYGTAGVNLGAWRLRSDYQYNRYDSGNGSVQSDFWLPQTYLFRALPSLRSKLTLGQTYLSSAIFDSFRFAGITLASDERMLPSSLQGYAPQISGIANSNAQVTVSQNGRILYQTRVSPGPFVLPDLSQNISGNLDVTVRESDGSVRTWQVNTASVPFMARQGQVRYKVAAGRPLYGGTHNNSTVSPDFLLGEATWGAFNNTSLYGGVIASTGDYQSVALGAAQNMGLFGAVSADVTRSDARLPSPSTPRQTGYSYRINYTKTFDSTGSTLAFVGYRFSDRHFLSLQEYLARSVYDGEYLQDEKQSYSVSWNQYLSALNMSASLSLSRLSYWNADSSNNWTLSLSKSANIGPVHGISLSLSLSRNQTTYSLTQNQVWFSASIPWGESRQVGYSLQHDSSGMVQQNATLSDFSHPDTSWSLGVGTRNDGSGRQLSGNIQSRMPYGQAGADFTQQSGQYRSLGLNWYGSVTATAHGAAFGQSMAGNEPRMMIDTDGVAGVPVSGGNGVTNHFGIAVVSAGSSYRPGDISVDVSDLPDGVDVSDSVVSQVLTEGSIGYKHIQANQGIQVLGHIRLADGKSPPFGAQVVSASTGRIAGMVGDDGLVYLTGVSPSERTALPVEWGGKIQCRLTLPDNAAITHGVLLLPCR